MIVYVVQSTLDGHDVRGVFASLANAKARAQRLSGAQIIWRSKWDVEWYGYKFKITLEEIEDDPRDLILAKIGGRKCTSPTPNDSACDCCTHVSYTINKLEPVKREDK